ncbi:MAG TPA: transporter associated domain-containing protein, partial [Thermomicrobiales bacterium]|nr:transporter associated domain-containing protein [Thermomicrobiales bacterium]
LDIDELPGEEDGHFETLGGFVIEQLGHIPEESEYVDHEGYRIEVADMDGHRIDKLLVSHVADAAATDRADST